MDHNSPAVSVVVPVYNAGRWLARCLDSIAAQTYPRWECILVDDGSADDSGSICDGYAAKDPRFRVIHKENGGVSSARNAGMDGILVLWGFRDRQTLERAGAKTFAATAEELCAALIG